MGVLGPTIVGHFEKPVPISGERVEVNVERVRVLPMKERNVSTFGKHPQISQFGVVFDHEPSPLLPMHNPRGTQFHLGLSLLCSANFRKSIVVGPQNYLEVILEYNFLLKNKNSLKERPKLILLATKFRKYH